jgi:hopene-associated glycosyltransferase HpnB
MTTLAMGALCCGIWIYLLAARGGFWRAIQDEDAPAKPPQSQIAWPRIVAVIPARDEAAIIGESIGTLLRQDYRGGFAIIVVDDHSSDDTAAAARHAAAAADASERLTVLAAPSLPGGWTGKLWAMHQGLRHIQALPEPPDYVLFTDADIHYADDTLTELVRRATHDRLVLISLMARLRCVSFAERALIPAFVFFFQMLYPFAWVNRIDRAIAAAAGGCMLARRSALQAAGGLEAIRSELIDDCALARLLKRQGTIRVSLTRRVESVRSYPTVGDVRRMVIRCAYAQLEFSPWWLAFATAAMIATYLTPPALALFGSGTAQLLGAVTWLLMSLALQPTLRFYGVSRWWGMALPAIAGAYLLFTLDSAWLHFLGKGGEWKGRLHRGTSDHGINSQGN